MADKYVIAGEEIEREITASLGEICNTLLKLYGDNVLQIDGETDEAQTASQILKRSIHLSKWLQKQGLKPGDVASIYAENRLEFTIFVVACFLSGITAAPINHEYLLGELTHVLNLSKPKIVFCSPLTVQKLIDIWPRNKFVKHIVLYGERRLKHNNVSLYSDIIRGYENVDLDNYQPVEIDPEVTVAAVLTSSGTTGLPKGVMVTHANIGFLMDIGRKLLTEFNLGEFQAGASVCVTPMFHSYGFITCLLNLLRGLKVVVMRKFNLKRFLEIIEKYKVTFLTVPPPVILLLVKHPLSKQYDLSSVSDLRCGAAPLGLKLEQEINDKFKLTVSQAFGMTETTLGVLVNRPGNKKIGSVGTVVPGMFVKIIDEEGNSLGPYEEGELCVKGPLIMKGYIGDPGSTAAAIDKDGWLHTGDVSYYDKDQFFFIVDRIKELIKYKAFQVAPAELEALLLTNKDIVDAAVIGLPDEMSGELPLAFVVKKAGARLTEKEVDEFIASKVSPQKQLRGGVIFIDEIPRNPTGKILRRVLKERAVKLKSKL